MTVVRLNRLSMTLQQPAARNILHKQGYCILAQTTISDRSIAPLAPLQVSGDLPGRDSPMMGAQSLLSVNDIFELIVSIIMVLKHALATTAASYRWDIFTSLYRREYIRSLVAHLPAVPRGSASLLVDLSYSIDYKSVIDKQSGQLHTGLLNFIRRPGLENICCI